MAKHNIEIDTLIHNHFYRGDIWTSYDIPESDEPDYRWSCWENVNDALAIVDLLKNVYDFHCNRNGIDSWDVRFGDKIYTLDVGAGIGKTLPQAISNALMSVIGYENTQRMIYVSP
jgi:hypothetical protein